MTTDGTNASAGAFSCQVSSLNENTTYYYKAYVLEYNAATQEYEERFADEVKSFTTTAQTALVPGYWLEMPSYTTSAMAGTTTSSLTDLYPHTLYATMNGATARNYSMLYDPEMYASYWVAYPMCYDHINGSGRSDQWAFDNQVPQSKQTNLTKGAYGVSYPSTQYTSNVYARGHQIANADRNGVDDMCDQTFFMTNLTPQIQNGFNGGIWNNLEDAVRALISSNTASTDTVYVVTGAAFRKTTDGTGKTITYITNTRDGKSLPVPNYYWKAVLKVKWAGSGDGRHVEQAKAIGFWYPHTELKGESYCDAKYVVNVDQIEEWTGFDLFHNLPDTIEAAAEVNDNWSTFQRF